jgi:hypothetical protein
MAGCDGAHRLIADPGKTETRRYDTGRCGSGDASPQRRSETSEGITATAGLRLRHMERTRGFEPRLLPWKGSVLQLHHVREASL